MPVWKPNTEIYPVGSSQEDDEREKITRDIERSRTKQKAKSLAQAFPNIPSSRIYDLAREKPRVNVPGVPLPPNASQYFPPPNFDFLNQGPQVNVPSVPLPPTRFGEGPIPNEISIAPVDRTPFKPLQPEESQLETILSSVNKVTQPKKEESYLSQSANDVLLGAGAVGMPMQFGVRPSQLPNQLMGPPEQTFMQKLPGYLGRAAGYALPLLGGGIAPGAPFPPSETWPFKQIKRFFEKDAEGTELQEADVPDVQDLARAAGVGGPQGRTGISLGTQRAIGDPDLLRKIKERIYGPALDPEYKSAKMDYLKRQKQIVDIMSEMYTKPEFDMTPLFTMADWLTGGKTNFAGTYKKPESFDDRFAKAMALRDGLEREKTGLSKEEADAKDKQLKSMLDLYKLETDNNLELMKIALMGKEIEAKKEKGRAGTETKEHVMMTKLINNVQGMITPDGRNKVEALVTVINRKGYEESGEKYTPITTNQLSAAIAKKTIDLERKDTGTLEGSIGRLPKVLNSLYKLYKIGQEE